MPSVSNFDQAYAISITGFSKWSDQFIGINKRHLDDNESTGDAEKM
jgi:hypothetical protein